MTAISLETFQLEKGSTATEYELPAPTPDSPIEIHSINDVDVVSSVGGRNLITGTNFNEPLRYRRDNRAGEFGWEIPINRFMTDMTPNDEFTISVGLRGKMPRPIVIFRIGVLSNSALHIVEENELDEVEFKRFSLTFKPHQDLTQLFIYSRYSYTPYTGWFEIEPNSVKLEKGTKATDWTPAPEDITENDNHPSIDKINLLLDEPLRSVGDVKDRLFRDSDGLWKIERNIWGETLDGSSNLIDYSDGGSYNKELTTNRTYAPRYNLPHSTTFTKTSHLKRDVEGYGLWSSERVGHLANGNNQFHLNVSNHTLGISQGDNGTIRTTKFRSWLQAEHDKGTPVRIQYALESPFIETLDQELQDKLNNLRSFQDSNYVYTLINDEADNLSDYVVDNLKPTLHTKFLYNNWYKEDRVINNLMIYNRALSDQEMLQNYRSTKHRWGM